ncbi:unnamed protein product [Meloidogyne enterolobii]|uniref:Uncharacterized protein n=1 Tax=Meloidogyne enterolobii TaxID=390850 RepID=A0ACB0XLY4_MELEN
MGVKIKHFDRFCSLNSFFEDFLAQKIYLEFHFRCHPHGLFSIGAFTHLCTSSTGFSEKFPGLKPNLLTLNGQFWFPFRREIGIGLGVESSAKSLRFVLNNPKGGALAGIVIGGAEEVLDSKPGSTDLNLMRRLGFCRIALETGASLVPSYSFGENDVYEQYTHPREFNQKILWFLSTNIFRPFIISFITSKKTNNNNCRKTNKS